jgi:ATP-binding cassette, subfamily B, bacterial
VVSDVKKKRKSNKQEPSARPVLALAGMPLVKHLVRSHWIALALACVAVLGETAADLLEPWPIKVVIDNVLQHKRLPARVETIVALFPQDSYATLNFAIAFVLMIAVLGAISSYSEKYLTTSVAQWVAHDLRRMVYQRIQRLSLAEHGESRTGDLLTRVTSDIDAVQDFITSALLGIVTNVLTLAGMLGVMFYMNWRFTLIGLSVAPVMFLFVYVYSKRIKKASRLVKKREGELMSSVSEKLTSIQVVQAFAREEYEDQRFDWESRQNVAAGLRARKTKARLSPLVDLLVAVGTCLVLGYGARLVMSGAFSTGQLIIFIFYLGKTYKPMKDLSKMTNTVAKAAISFERIQELLDMESRVRDMPGARPAPRFSGALEFDRITFSYDGTSPILSNVSLRIEPGQVAAIVGPSGTGKTTIAGLIPRFFDPQSGRITIDGHDIREFTLKSLREQVSFVLQDTLLFRGTVWENIAYGKPEAEIEETVRAAEEANAHEFIVRMPESYATMVGERGVTLSGGQRRRIAIARAIVRDTPILILDEPTAGLDAASEQYVTEALERLMKGRTSIVIAHHLNTIRHADVIFVVKDAEIVERGTYDELLAKSGVFAGLHAIQSSGTELRSENLEFGMRGAAAGGAEAAPHS